MKFFRTHITRLSGFLMLMLGMLLHYGTPLEQGEDHQAFTSWLGSHLKSNDEDVLSKIDALSDDKESLEKVIRKASELVSSHSDDFKIPVSEDEKDTPDEVYMLLLTEWNHFKDSGSGMGKAVFTQNVKPYSVLPADGNNFSSAPEQKNPKVTRILVAELYIQDFTSPHHHILSPLKSGTAIGAP